MPDEDDDDDKRLLHLADAVEGLRAELTSAIERGDHQRERMRFRVTEPVVLEVQAVTTTDAHGKVGWKIVEVGGSRTAANTHKITLKLSPEWWDGTTQAYTTSFLISAELPAQAVGPAVEAPSGATAQVGGAAADQRDRGDRAHDRLAEDDA